MQVLVETVEGCKKRATITLLSDDVEEAIKKEIIKTAKTAKIDGFRKGKAPIRMIEQRYGQSILQDILIDLMQNHFSEAVTKEDINIVSRPHYLPGEYKKNENYTYSVEFEVYPEIELKDLELIEVEKPIVSISDHDVDELLKKLREQQMVWQDTTDLPSALEDRVTIDFNGSIDGEAFEDSSDSDFVMILGEGSMVPGFEESIVGHKAGEKFTINVTFPETDYLDSVKGKEAQFLIHLKKIEKGQLPELNEEFIKSFNLTRGSSIEALRAEIRKNMELELKKRLRTYIKEQIIQDLLNLNKTEVPLYFIEDQIKVLRKKAESYGIKYGIKKEMFRDLPRELFAERAENEVLTGLLLNKLIEQNDLTVDENKVDAFLEEIASTYEDPEETIQFYKKNEKMMNHIRDFILEEEAIETLLKQAKVTEKQMSFNEFNHQINEINTVKDADQL